MTTYSNDDNRRSGLVFLLLAIALVGLGIMALQLANLPLSRHAVEEPHSLDADTIRFQMQNKTCKPLSAFYCSQEGNKHYKLLCPLNENIWAGLIIGMEGFPQIVSGYPASKAYWKKTLIRDFCTPANVPSF